MAQKIYHKCPEYYDFILSLPSWISKSTQNVECHHAGLGRRFSGLQKRQFDFASIPLTATEHSDLHFLGQKKYLDGKINNIHIVYWKLMKLFCKRKSINVEEIFSTFPEHESEEINFIIKFADSIMENFNEDRTL